MKHIEFCTAFRLVKELTVTENVCLFVCLFVTRMRIQTGFAFSSQIIPLFPLNHMGFDLASLL